MRGRPALVSLALVLRAVPGTASAAEPGEHSGNMSYVKNLEYAARNGDTPNFGTDIEFAKLQGRQYALAGSYNNGLQIVDIKRPRKARIAAVYDCGVTQGDPQVFRQADEPGRTFATYTSDTHGDGTSTCYLEAAALGFDVLKENRDAKNGTFIVDITDPRHPKTVSFAEVPQGSHNQTVHPSGQLPLQLELGPDHIAHAGDRDHRHQQPGRAARRRRAAAAHAAGARHGVARHLVQPERNARVLGRALPGCDHRHHRPGQARDHHELPRPGDQRLARG
jgi:hypothetical protein